MSMNDNQNQSDDYYSLSVSKALRKSEGKFTIHGTIISISKLYKLISEIKIYCEKCNIDTDIKPEFPTNEIDDGDLICSNCHKKTTKILDRIYSSAINIELQDSETFNDIDRLVAILLDRDTENIRVGERVLVKAKVRIAPNNGKQGKLFPYFYAESITYEDRKETTLNDKDIENIKSYVSLVGKKNVIDKLTDMFDPSIIGFRHVKKGILLSAVNTGIRKNRNKSFLIKGERINILLVGDPGLGKSKILRSAVKLVENSRYESGENSSGKSLTAIVSKEDDNYILRSGSMVLTRYSFCAINEISNIPTEEQNHFLSIMEEGEFSLNKHGVNATIHAPTTILASANPIHSEWKNRDKIDLNEIPIKKQILDRFDLKFPFIQENDPTEIKKYAYEKSMMEKKKISQNPVFLIKYIAYAKRLDPVFTSEACIMLDQFFVSLIINRTGSYRVRETLYKLAKAISRLKLKTEVDVDDAMETMEFYNMVYAQFNKIVVVSPDPRIVAIDECITILSNIKCGISLEELFLKACERNEHVKQYFGFDVKRVQLHIANNKKTRYVYEHLMNHSNVKRIQEKPVVLQWFDNNDEKNVTIYTNNNNSSDFKNPSVKSTAYDLCDQYDHKSDREAKPIHDDNNSLLKNHFVNTENHNVKNIQSHKSHRSDNTFALQDTINSLEKEDNSLYSFRCYYCPKTFQTEAEYMKHCLNIHHGKIARPDKKLLILLKLEPKGNPWETDKNQIDYII